MNNIIKEGEFSELKSKGLKQWSSRITYFKITLWEHKSGPVWGTAPV
jgi:hypothetical protein